LESQLSGLQVSLLLFVQPGE